MSHDTGKGIVLHLEREPAAGILRVVQVFEQFGMGRSERERSPSDRQKVWRIGSKSCTVTISAHKESKLASHHSTSTFIRISRVVHHSQTTLTVLAEIADLACGVDPQVHVDSRRTLCCHLASFHGLRWRQLFFRC
eukprot:195935-Rhodomonas_salina.1